MGIVTSDVVLFLKCVYLYECFYAVNVDRERECDF